MEDDKLQRSLAGLDRALAELPDEVEPARDLWPGIEARITPAANFGWQNFALAASVCLALAVGALLWFGQDPGEEFGPTPATGLVDTGTGLPGIGIRR